jgi:hypothetical protein
MHTYTTAPILGSTQYHHTDVVIYKHGFFVISAYYYTIFLPT